MSDQMTGVVEAVRRDGKGFKIGEDWYSSFNPISGVNRGDEVSFNYARKGQYLNIKGKVTVVGAGSTNASRPQASNKPNTFNLGVELGHASNLAMRMMEQRLKSGDPVDVGSKEYYEVFMKDTDTIYKVMSALRDKAVKQVEEKAEEAKATSTDVNDEDIFG